MGIGLIQGLLIGKEGIIRLEGVLMHALLHPVIMAQSVQYRTDPVVLQIRLDVSLEIPALFDVDIPNRRVNLS